MKLVLLALGLSFAWATIWGFYTLLGIIILDLITPQFVRAYSGDTSRKAESWCVSFDFSFLSLCLISFITALIWIWTGQWPVWAKAIYSVIMYVFLYIPLLIGLLVPIFSIRRMRISSEDGKTRVFWIFGVWQCAGMRLAWLNGCDLEMSLQTEHSWSKNILHVDTDYQRRSIYLGGQILYGQMPSMLSVSSQ
ncbi:hypothetical protein JXA32_03575 [Candidatus Sumerlaeota bacterium]|nr:hypothetical protein [Candidatus Sumerlaeota bacterium]